MPQLETITATFTDGFRQLKPDTFQTSAELMTARRTDKELRSEYFHTANFAMYDVEDGEAVLYFGGREANPILSNIDEACDQITNYRDYHVPEEDRQAVIASAKSGHTLRVKLSDLDLIDISRKISHFKIDTENYDELNDEQRAFAEQVYGNGDDFVQNMEMLRAHRIETTSIHTLNPNYVITIGAAVALGGWLDDMHDKSAFLANDNYSPREYNSLRGVRSLVLD